MFLLTFFSIYGAIHLYLFVKARSALALGLGLSLALALFLTAMVLAPVGIRLLDRSGFPMAARVLAYVGYTWMGLIFLFLWMGICLDIFNLIMRLLAKVSSSGTSRLVWDGKHSFLALVLGVILLGIWSVYSAWQIRLDQISLQTAKLPAQRNRLNIVQISDLHLGMMVGEQRLERILKIVRKAEPDLLVCTGDLVDAQMDESGRLANMLAQIRPPLGKFAVLGNHEFYAGTTQSERFLQGAGFKVLRNQSYHLDDLLTIVGMDDPVVGRYLENKTLDQTETSLLKHLDSHTFTLLLKHRPAVEPESVGHFDLQLSGHTHGGQIFPFSLITEFFYANQSGLVPLDKDSLLYVNRGAGTWGPPMRLLSPPHVTVIELSGLVAR